MSRTERLYQIVRMLEDARHPVPLSHFLDTLEISRASFKRDLEYLRDRLGAPIAWQRGKLDRPEGYVLDETDDDPAAHYGIRGMWFNPSEIHALLMMQQLAAGMEPGLVAGQVSGLMTRIGLMLGSATDDPEDIRRRIRILHSASRRTTPRAFDTVAQATMKRRRLRLHYFARSRNEESERIVSPQQLLHYRENWYLLAWCHKARELRTFALDAMREATPCPGKVREVGTRTLEKAIGPAFGIFSGTATQRAELRFSPAVAPWIRNEIWHPDQRLRDEADGSVRLSVPYGDPRELLMEILRYGADVEVMAPAALRRATAARLEAALAHYPEASDGGVVQRNSCPTALSEDAGE